MHCVSEECIRFKCRQDEACIGIIGRSRRKAGGTLPPATLLHIEKTQWSPNCRIKAQGQGRSVQTFSGSPVQYLEAVGTFPHALPALPPLPKPSASFSKSILCRVLFCSRDCCLCTKHQSVKELRHAGSKGKNKQTEKPNKRNHKTTNKQTTRTKTTATTQLPFAAGETGETG